ncbi:MAG: UDP-3-O-(3-hydroxymyristoyl)glucosamine N-acyltransferase, partial [Bdellovibrionales bacterium]|nr:UDP-3-O-(3-hydroxymyristoyl)glucosamine N-acyltransferase [Bdellovibrionales bacterium]
MSVSAEILLQTYPELLKYLAGDKNKEAEAPCSQTHLIKNAIAYVADASMLSATLQSEIAILVVHDKISAKALELNSKNKTLLATQNTYLSMALINSRFFALPSLKAPFEKIMIHPSAQVASTAKIGQNVILSPGAVIYDNVTIGDGTFIGANSVIEANTIIGQNCFFHPQVYVGHTCKIGDRVEIKPHSTVGSDGYGYAHDAKGNHYRIPHYGPVIIEDDVHIGANVNIDRGTFDPAIIGAGTKIDNHCHLGHNIKVGKNCLITAGIIVAGSSTIGDNCVFAGRVSVNGHI